jgi:hypothetical protein
MPGDSMPAGPHRCRQVVFTAEADRRHHIGDTPASGDQGRPSLDVPVPDLPGDVEGRVMRLNQLAREVRSQRLDGCAADHRHGDPLRIRTSMSRLIVVPLLPAEKCND